MPSARQARDSQPEIGHAHAQQGLQGLGNDVKLIRCCLHGAAMTVS